MRIWKWRVPRREDASSFPAFRVRAEGTSVSTGPVIVELNGMDITKGLTELSIHSAVGHPHRIVLHMFCGELDVDLEALDDLQLETSLIRSEDRTAEDLGEVAQ